MSQPATTGIETVPTRWTDLDDSFFTLVGDTFSLAFLWGTTTLLASYDADDPDLAGTTADVPRQRPAGVTLPAQRSLAP